MREIQVTLDDSNIRDFLQHRDTDTEFSNEGRIERQKVYMSAYVDKIKSLDESKLEDTWNSLDSMKDYHSDEYHQKSVSEIYQADQKS